MESYSVCIGGDDLLFSAAHFITFGDSACESLHGHDFRVRAEVTGPLGEGDYVVDFTELRGTLQGILAELDHRIVLPARHRALEIKEEKHEIEARLGARRWLFPREDCVLLNVANTTAELLARWLVERLAAELKHATRIRVELAEGTGQSAACEWTPD